MAVRAEASSVSLSETQILEFPKPLREKDSVAERNRFELAVPILEQRDDSCLFQDITESCRQEVSETALEVRIHFASPTSLCEPSRATTRFAMSASRICTDPRGFKEDGGAEYGTRRLSARSGALGRGDFSQSGEGSTMA